MSTQEIDKILARESLELLEAVQRNEPGAAERLAKWLKQSRRHTEHYLMTVAFERELDRVEFDSNLDLRTPSSPTNVVALDQGTATLKHRDVEGTVGIVRGRVGWIAAAVVAGFALLGMLSWETHRNVYTTAVGEQRAIELDDGSVIHLNTQSQLAVRFSDGARDIELRRGEALFKVHRDPSRPFRVHTADALIQAVGTEFNVYRRPEGTTVAVLEGRVKVSGDAQETNDANLAKEPRSEGQTASLGSGEQAKIDHSGQIATQAVKDVESVASWRQRRLIFAGTPLPQIVAEFNRYNRAPQLVIAGGDVSDRVYSGVFDADDPESLIQLLEREPAMRVEREEGEVVIRVEGAQ